MLDDPTVPAFRVLVYSDARALGGAERTLAEVLAGLPRRITVDILGVDADVVEWLAGHREGTGRHVLEPIRDRSDLRNMAAHRRRFRELRPDIVHFNLSTMSSCQWPILVAQTVRGVRTVAVENSPMGTWSGMSRRLKSFTSPRLAGHVAVGERTARQIEEQANLQPGSVGTMYHGVQPPGRAEVPDAGDGRAVLGTIARHDPVKGLDLLLAALVRLPDARLVLIGDGPERANLERLVDELGLVDRVEFRHVPWGERAGDHLATFDLFVLPSRLEGLPVTIMEALLAGTPMVVTDVGSVREAVTDGETGIIVPPEDVDALVAAIRTLLDDPGRRATMGARAAEAGRARFTVDATVRRYVDLYRRALGLPCDHSDSTSEAGLWERPQP